MGGRTRIAYLVHDLNDPAVARRIAMLRTAGADVAVAGFHRGARAPDAVAGAPATDLGRTADLASDGRPTLLTAHGRHDPCVGLRAAPIAEAMLALVLIDHALRHRAQNADVQVNTPNIAKLEK